MYSSLESVEEVEEILFFAHEVHLKGTDVPDGIVRKCDKLCNSGYTHDNVAAFLGLIVEEHVPPVAKIFEEYAEGEWTLNHVYCTIYCETQWCVKVLLLSVSLCGNLSQTSCPKCVHLCVCVCVHV